MNYQSDKIGNPIIERYKELFDKNASLNILEVGIAKGGFLNWLSDYFKNATVYGIDINIKQVEELKDGIRIFQCSQNNTERLYYLGSKYGSFDFIIDDGCHFRRETENTFNTMWPYIRKGGWYAIEDWGMGFSIEPVYKGMATLILSIIERQEQLKIKEFNIIKEPSYSVALFKK